MLARIISLLPLEDASEVDAGPLAGKIGIVHRRRNRHGRRRAVEEIREAMNHLLQRVLVESVLVAEDDVVRWASCALEAAVGLHVEVPRVLHCYASVDDDAGFQVRAGVATDEVVGLLRVEALVVTLSDHDQGEGWVPILFAVLLASVDCIYGVPKTTQFVLKYRCILTITDAIAEDDDTAWIATCMCVGPMFQALVKHSADRSHNLFLGSLGSETNWPDTEVCVDV